MTAHEYAKILDGVVPTSPAGADLILDLRQLLLEQGHPGHCVRCFFGLLGQLDQPGALKPLRRWLEKHLEIEVLAAGSEIEVLPLRLDEDTDLEQFCRRAIRTIRFDRDHAHPQIEMRFRYTDQVTAA